MSTLLYLVLEAPLTLREKLLEWDPLLVAAGFFLIGAAICYLYILNITERSLFQRARDCVFYYGVKLPYVHEYIQKEFEGVVKDLMTSIHGDDKRESYMVKLPEKGLAIADIVKMAEDYNVNDRVPKYLDGRVSGAVFNDEKDTEEMRMYTSIFEKYAYTNPLWPKLFPGVRKMETEVVRMACGMMHGDENSCGTMSTGGTISILLACLAHRNRALSRGVNFPEMILPASCHAAFFKAGEVFRVKIRKIPVHPVTFKVDLRKMRAAINSRTCMLVGSAPNFPFGTMDDIPAIAAMGEENDIPVHVDACLGGFLLPFLKQHYDFDFRIPGVSSISADSHKYGLTPKGSSVVLYRNKDYRKHQYFGDVDWQGGIYASATMEGSRCGLNIALAWSSLVYHGRQYYEREAELLVETTKKIRDGIKSIPQFRVQGDSDICIVSWTSDKIDIFRYHDLIGKKGFQLSALQFPTGVHIMVTQLHTKPGFVDVFIDATREVIEHILATPDEPAEGSAAMYGMTQKVPDRKLVKEFACAYLDATYALPDQ